jgi:hypothetical protein
MRYEPMNRSTGSGTMFDTRRSTPLARISRGRAVACCSLTALFAVVVGCDTKQVGVSPPPADPLIIVTVTETGSPAPGVFELRAEATVTGDDAEPQLQYAWTVIYGEGVFEPSADQATVTLRATQAGPIKVQVEITTEGETASGTGAFDATVDGGLNVTAVAVPDPSNNGNFELLADVVETGEFTYTWENDPSTILDLEIEDSGQPTLNVTAIEETSYTVLVRVARVDADGPEEWGSAKVWFSYGRFLYDIACPARVPLGDEDTISNTLLTAPNNPTGDITCTEFNVAEGTAEIVEQDYASITLHFDTLGDVVVTMHMINMHTGRNGERESDCDTFTVGGDDVFMDELTEECTIQVVPLEETDVDTDGDEGDEEDGTDGDDDAPPEPSDDPCGDYVDYYNGLPCITTPLHTSGTCDPMSAAVCEGIDEFYDCLIVNTNCVDGALVEDIDPCGLLLDCG